MHLKISKNKINQKKMGESIKILLEMNEVKSRSFLKHSCKGETQFCVGAFFVLCNPRVPYADHAITFRCNP